MKTKETNFRLCCVLLILFVFGVLLVVEPLSAQQNHKTQATQKNNRVGNITVNGVPVGQAPLSSSVDTQPVTTLAPSTLQRKNASVSKMNDDVRTPTNIENGQLTKLSELTPPPRPNTTTHPSQRQPALLIAEPLPAMAQQAPRAVPKSPPTDGAKPISVPDSKLVSEKSQSPLDDAAAPDIQQAFAFFQRGDMEKAKQILDEAFRKNPNLPPPGIFLAQFAANSQQDNRIRYWLDFTAWEQPNDPEAYVLLADQAINDNRLMDAKLLVEKGITLLSNISTNKERSASVESLTESVQGRLYQLREDWSTARVHFEKLAALEPENPEWLTRLGFIAAHQGQYDDAVVLYQKAIAGGAKLPTPKLIVSQIADQVGKTDIADKYFTEVMQATDIDPQSIRIAVQIQLRRGDIEEAEKFLARAIKVEPDNFENLVFAGTINLFKKDFVAAEKRFQDAVLIRPDNYAALHGLALALIEQEDSLKKERALAYAKSNVQNSGESPESVATLAWVYFKSGKLIEAEYLIDLILASGELSPLNAYFLAEIAAGAGQNEKALALVKIATASKSNFMKKAEAETLQKRLESESSQSVAPPISETPPQQPAEVPLKKETSSPVRIPGTRN